MKADSWSLPLDPSRPQSLFETIDMFGHIFVLEAPINARLLSDAGIKGMARWAGMVRRKTDTEISGIGLIGWLGDDTNKGRIYLVATLPSGTNGTFLPWVRDQILNFQPGAQSITFGSGTDIATPTYTGTFQYVTPRQALDFVCNWFVTGEYKVLPDFTLICGKASDPNMFVTTPKVVLLDGEGGRDLNIKGIPATLTVSRDVEDYATTIEVHGADYGSATISPTTSYKDGRGNLVNITNLVQAPQATAGQAPTVAAGLVKVTDHLRVAVQIQTDQYDVPADLAAGDWVNVLDVPSGLYDSTNPVRFRGRYLFPASVRCYAVTWPFERGYTILYRDLNGIYTDLTPWIAWESPGTTLEVGAPMRALAQ